MDRQGLLALWREALLAKKVLADKTRGYRHHPQLDRFREHPRPLQAIDNYLYWIWREACQRGYCFDRRKIGRIKEVIKIRIRMGQIEYEYRRLRSKIKARCPNTRPTHKPRRIETHPLFKTVAGPIEAWERS
jgi:hypothetical protein